MENTERHGGSRSDKFEPQNIEQGISNDEGRESATKALRHQETRRGERFIREGILDVEFEPRGHIGREGPGEVF